MAEETLTIKLSGAITLTDFAEAMGRYDRFVRALAAEADGRAPVTFAIDGLQTGSTMTSVEVSSPSARVVTGTLQGYHEVSQVLARRGQLAGHSRRVQNAGRKVAEIIQFPSVESVRLESVLGEALLVRPTAAERDEAPQLRYSYGALQGRVDTLTRRRGLRFVLYDLLTDNAISCYLVPGQEERVRDTWGYNVLVRGEIGRDPRTWRPEVVRQIVDVVMLSDVDASSYRSLRGKLRPPANAPAPEVRIRRLRDEDTDAPELLG